MRHLLFRALLFASLACRSAAEKHPFNFEDMMQLKRISEPVPSPDGKWMLFAAQDVDLKANTKTPHVWIVPMAGGRERNLIPDQDADRPRWAPDGKRFAFISTKQGGSQVWIADFDRASGTVISVHKLTSIPTEADGELWSPDGKNLLFKSDVYPQCDGSPEQDCNAKKLDVATQSKLKAQIFTKLLYRHWNVYKEGKRTHLFVVPGEIPGIPAGPGEMHSDLRYVPAPRDITPGDFDAPPFSLGGQDNYAFSPDGQEICYTANHDPVEATSTNNDLWIVPVNAGTGLSPQTNSSTPAKNITADNQASDSTPLYSPDGKYIAYRAQARPGYESDRFRLMLYDRSTGRRSHVTDIFVADTEATAIFDRWVGTYTWAKDSKRIFFVAETEGRALVYEVGSLDVVARGQTIANPRPVQTGHNDDLALGQGDGNIVFTRMSIMAPNEIYKSGTEVGPCEDLTAKASPGSVVVPTKRCQFPSSAAVTHLNDSVLSHVSMSPLESFWFPGAHGDRVQGFLLKPPNFDPSKKYPVKFLIHGGPQSAWGDSWSYRWNANLFAADGYVVIMINFHGSTGYGQRFIDAINGDWGGAPFEDLMKGLDYAEQHYSFVDKNRECALGASYGGYMVNWILGHTDRFQCLVSHDSTFNTESAWGSTEELWFPEWEFKGPVYTNRELYRKWSPHLFATNFKTPTLVIHGQKDYRLDVSEGFQLFTTLQRLGVPSKMLYFPDEGHWVLKPQNSQLWYKTVNEWVDQWIGRSKH